MTEDAPPFFVLQLAVVDGGIQPMIAWAKNLTPAQLQLVAAGLNIVAADFSAMYPPSEAEVDHMARARANGFAIREAESIVRNVQGGE